MDINFIVGLVVLCFVLFTLSGLILISCGIIFYTQKQIELLEKKDELEKLSLQRKRCNDAYDRLYSNLLDSTKKRKK